MPLLDTTKPEVIRFLQESYEKEKYLRIKWLKLHEDIINKAGTINREFKNYTVNDINETIMIKGMAATSRDNIVAARHKIKVKPPDYLSVKIYNPKPVQPSMLPIKQEIKDVLLQSRRDYLAIRNKEDPENKYYYMETTNWKHGWKFKESNLKMGGPEHGKISHMSNITKQRVGPQPDPDYY